MSTTSCIVETIQGMGGRDEETEHEKSQDKNLHVDFFFVYTEVSRGLRGVEYLRHGDLCCNEICNQWEGVPWLTEWKCDGD